MYVDSERGSHIFDQYSLQSVYFSFYMNRDQLVVNTPPVRLLILRLEMLRIC